jgi:hypothetical protein
MKFAIKNRCNGSVKNLPAYRYELFVKAFEKKVTAAQQAIERMRQMEQPYNILKEVMEAERLPNEQQIWMESSYIAAHVTATENDSLEAFETLAARIGKALLDAKLHRDGVPATSHGGSTSCLWFCWHCGKFDARLFVKVPETGMRDVKVLQVERKTVDYDYVMQRIEPKTYPAPDSFKSGSPTASELARIEAELGAADKDEILF